MPAQQGTCPSHRRSAVLSKAYAPATKHRLHDDARSAPDRPKRSESAAYFYAAFAVVLTVVLALIWSHFKLIWVDELLVLETDSLPSVRQVLFAQLHTPIALDPAGYHLVVHGFLRVLGNTAFALRLTSLVGFVCMQVCVFAAVRRIAGARAAVVALLLTAISGTFYFATETRPYGMLLGCFGLVLLGYVRSTEPHATASQQPRTAWLVLLGFGIGLAINTHYFGILVLAPVAVAEGTRLLLRRRIDLQLALAVLAGAAAYVFTKPFQPAALRYRLHYYNAGAVEIHALIRSFRLILLSLQFSPGIQRISSIAMLLFCLVCFLVPVVHLRHRRVTVLPHQLAFLITLSLLPFIGGAVGRFVTHSFEVRYVLGAVVGYCALFAIAVTPPLRSRTSFHAVALILLAVIVGTNLYRIHLVKVDAADTLAKMQLTPQQREALLSGDDPNLYIQNGGSFQQIAWYLHDPDIRPRLTLLYGFPQEMGYAMRDTNSLTADHMRAFTGFRITPWDEVFAQPGEHRLLLYKSPWDWVPVLLKDPTQHAHVRDLGPALGGELYGVTLAAPPK